MTLILLISQILCWQNAFAFQPNPRLQIDDRQPGIMTFLPSQLSERVFQQYGFEFPYIQESVFSFTQEKDVSVRELAVFSAQLGYNHNIHHFGLQISGNIIDFWPKLSSLNYQIDFLRMDDFLFSLTTMYGGFGYVRERYGVRAMVSKRVESLSYFATLQLMKSRRHFYSAHVNFDRVNGSPNNSLSYLLENLTPGIGLRYHYNEFTRAAFEINLGWEFNRVADKYRIQIEPVNYTRSDGFVLAGSVILPIENFNLPNTIEDFAQ